jgi:acyl carrier protein
MSETLALLTERVGKMLNQGSLDPDATLASIGIDSLNVVELILICQEIYPTASHFESLEVNENSTLRDIDQQLNEAN